MIEYLSLAKDDTYSMDTLDNKILLLKSGNMSFSFGKHIDQKLESGEMIVIPSSFSLTSKILLDSEILIFRIRGISDLCERFGLEQLMVEKEKAELSDTDDANILLANEIIDDYLNNLLKHIKAGLKCSYFLDLKIKELFFILRAYYEKENLYNFFSPLLSNDISFSNLIMKSYHQVKTVRELAELTNYSLSGFEKHFKKVFGISASQWLKTQKAKLVYHDINDGNKTFKEISYLHGFTSPAHFNDFCKNQFGATPGQIRKQKYLNDKSE